MFRGHKKWGRDFSLPHNVPLGSPPQSPRPVSWVPRSYIPSGKGKCCSTHHRSMTTIYSVDTEALFTSYRYATGVTTPHIKLIILRSRRCCQQSPTVLSFGAHSWQPFRGPHRALSCKLPHHRWICALHCNNQ